MPYFPVGEKGARVSKGQARAGSHLPWCYRFGVHSFFSAAENCLSQPLVHGREMYHLLLAS